MMCLGFSVAGVLALRYLWVRRVRRKRLVRAALAVINNYRAQDQMRQPTKDAILTYTVMTELIEATRDVN